MFWVDKTKLQSDFVGTMKLINFLCQLRLELMERVHMNVPN